MVGEFPVVSFTVGAGGHLQIGDRFRIPHVAVATATPVEVAGVWQYRYLVLVAHRIANFVALFHLFIQRGEVDALHAAGCADEAALDYLIGQTHGFEDLRTLIGLQRRDTHLGHNLQHALAHAFLVRGHNRSAVGKLFLVQQAVLQCLPNRLEGDVGVDGVCAVTDQQAVMVHFARFTGLQDDADTRALMRGHQMVMYRATGDQ